LGILPNNGSIKQNFWAKTRAETRFYDVRDIYGVGLFWGYSKISGSIDLKCFGQNACRSAFYDLLGVPMGWEFFGRIFPISGSISQIFLAKARAETRFYHVLGYL
jgi:hypothetical protein